MAVTHRLRELRAAGKHELADTLAVEALRNERPTVTVAGDHVRVETRTFVGEHALASGYDLSDEASVRDALSRRGTYGLADHDGRTFSTGALYDDVVAALFDDAATVTPEHDTPDSDATADVAATAPDEAVPDATVETTDADDQVGPVRPVESSRGPAAVLRQAVAAVQSQFRS